jgi:hypothetical protein
MTISKKEVLDNIEEVKRYIEETESVKTQKVGIVIKSVTGRILFESSKTNLVEAIREADLREADLSGADLSGADLSEANLSVVDLSGADLRGADLRGANLSGADLSEANLSGADLSEADLREANLSRADIYGADLSRSELIGAKFYGLGGHKPLKKSQLPDFLAALGFDIVE